MKAPRGLASRMRAVMALATILAPGIAVAGPPPLDHAMSTWASVRQPPAYRYALTDLNTDGKPDAIVLVSDPKYCGSGGCSFLVFQGTSIGFKVVCDATITREPIYVLNEVRSGWRTLSVWVAGGGVEPGQVLMRFNGREYPGNPSMEPRAPAADLKTARQLTLQ